MLWEERWRAGAEDTGEQDTAQTLLSTELCLHLRATLTGVVANDRR